MRGPVFPGKPVARDSAGSHEGGNEDGLVVYLAALVPHDSSHPFSLARARPAVDEAVLQLQKRGIFKRDTIKVIYKDSACSTTRALGSVSPVVSQACPRLPGPGV
ncbi:hypothetical protein RRG08_015758 [Elysia crispata]|uniref:Uncharacterized protein n=1 Tax=Elysia crispata TaxID=231223 RepID=A0AAE1DGW1_9GAST|nr:hypothetical protein RRG08_015758 [Elysia crispata]